MEMIMDMNFRKKHTVKLRGLALQMDALTYTIFILGIVCMGVLSWSVYKDMSNSSTASVEMDNIQTAIISYQAYNSSGKAPADLSILFADDALPASSSADGRVHGNFLSSTNRWSSGIAIDPWGEPYTIVLTGNDRHGTIQSTGSGETISKSF